MSHIDNQYGEVVEGLDFRVLGPWVPQVSTNVADNSV